MQFEGVSSMDESYLQMAEKIQQNIDSSTDAYNKLLNKKKMESLLLFRKQTIYWDNLEDAGLLTPQNCFTSPYDNELQQITREIVALEAVHPDDKVRDVAIEQLNVLKEMNKDSSL